jgi:hypothetical protein
MARGSGDRWRHGNVPREESPGSSEERCRIMPGEGDLRESATESRPPCFDRVRAKGCGKSAPRRRQRRRHGKPHREQNRIGAAYGFPPSRRPGWLLERRSNSAPRGMIAYRPQGRGQNPAYRPSGTFSHAMPSRIYIHSLLWSFPLDLSKQGGET